MAFQFTAGDGTVELTMNAGAGSGGGVNAGAISGISNTISVLSSYESTLSSIATPQDLDYVNFQATNITGTGDGYALDVLKLSDGGFDLSDLDGAPTVIDDLTIGLSNPQAIRKIAIYQQDPLTLVETEIAEQSNAAITVVNGYGTITFTNLNISAPDSDVTPGNNGMNILVLATFDNTAPNITDGDFIQVVVLGATLNIGSKFAPDALETGTIGGIATALNSPFTLPEATASVTVGSVGPLKRIQVTATSLDFTTAASSYAGTGEPVGPSYSAPGLPVTSAAIVEARDEFALLDTDFTMPATSINITDNAGESIASPTGFINGVLDLDGLTYGIVGDGTLRIQAGGVDSANPPPANTSAIPGQLVNVVNVTATIATNGVLTSPNIKGGAINQVLFGVTFTPDNNSQTMTEPSLKKFIFTFDKPYETPLAQIFKNFDVTESNTANFGNSNTVTITSATITKGATPATALLGAGYYDQVIVDWGANPPRDLFDPLTGTAVPLSYFLVADVDATANISTPSLIPGLYDGGYGTQTDDNIVTTAGTAVGSVVGNTYQFASTRPPVLLAGSSSPFSGQLNVDPGITSIFLRFDVEVLSLDGKAELYNRNTNTKVADLQAVSLADYTQTGSFTTTANPIEFQINFLGSLSFQPDTVYYVTIKKGTFNNVTNVGQGISDSGLNYYGGISSNGTYYFKISSQNPPALSLGQAGFSNTSIGTFRTTFDQAGNAHYLVLTSGSTPPTTSEILSPGTYGFPANIKASGNYVINQVNTPQTVTFSSSLALSTSYDVWVFARNDAKPTPLPLTGPPYGAFSSGLGLHPIGASGPTFILNVPSVVQTSFQPVYSVCPDSFVNLSAPIIIGETNLGDFSSASVQDFYILLPSGYEFDGIKLPTVILNGSDFVGVAMVDFINNTLVHVVFSNNGATSKDHIIITDLRIKGITGSNPGTISKFAGTNMLPSNPNLASISLFPANPQSFINSYANQNTILNSFVALTPTGSLGVTAIPDNYIDVDPLIPGAVRLLPQITPANDFGASFFTGTGVTDDKLTLSAVSLNSAFDITMIHTDPNGCLSETSVQYLVYDHKSPISPLLGSSAAGTQQALVNPNFPGAAPSPNFTIEPRINSTDLAGYKLIQLDAALPVNNSTQIMNSTDGWNPVVNSIPVEVNAIPTTDIPSTAVDDGFYRDYQWDYSKVLNATSNGIVLDPYDNFKNANATPIGNTYWEGGSLGKVEFTGLFQSTADFQVLVPFRQEVELFVPAIPLIEIGSGNVSSFNTPDGTLNTLDNLTPAQHIKSILYTQAGGYPGTPIFCEAGGLITVNGYPAASAGFSTGSFRIFEYTTFDFSNNTGVQILSGLVDNGNGTATINPADAAVRNNYEHLLVTYEYKENNSPAIGTGYLVIRVAPNPIADFTQVSLSDPNVSPLIPTAYCEGKQIEFDGSLSGFGSNGAGGTSISEFSWNFGDNINSTSTNPNTVSGAQLDPGPGGSTIEKPYHQFLQSAPYNVSLNVTSDVGCSSTSPALVTVNVGGIPSVAFAYEGVSIADPMIFTDNSSVNSGGGITDGINQIDWDFGALQTPQSITANFSTSVTNLYAAAGSYDVTETVTSMIGCVSTGNKTIVMLEKFVADETNPYVEDFDTDNGNWQVLKDPSFAGTASWAWGVPTTSVITKTILSPPLSDNNVSLWTTNLSGSYSGQERSYLYTTCIDMSLLLRPMISFNSFVQLAQGDGVVIEYSLDTKNIADPTKNWELLGNYLNSIESGVDWYKASALPSKPGNNQTVGDYGWAGDAVEKWMESKHILDEINNPTPQSNVVFRFAIASVNDSPGRDGFAIDNMRIGNRTRTVLIENFTNKANPKINQSNGIIAEKFESDELRMFGQNIAGTRLVKVNYHVGFPRIDPFNLDNPADPSARALYYNITQTPLARLDGFKNQGAEDYFSNWGATQYGIRTLQLAQADLVISTVVNADNGLQVDVQVIAHAPIPANARLHVAMLEKNVPISSLSSNKGDLIITGETDFEYVLKKMLPSAIGTALETTLLPTDPPKNFSFTWYPDKAKLYDLPDDLVVVAFLQNEDTREILQSEILEPIADPPLVTGLDLASFVDRIGIYPNPADAEVKIILPAPSPKEIQLQMIDQMGRVVNRSIIEKGKDSADIDTKDMAAGIYMVLFGNGDTSVFKKVMIVHRN
ncbi:MAG TPA: T9SS type A sorting domain-containing protein [Cyclobacteriaceae bacterium]